MAGVTLRGPFMMNSGTTPALELKAWPQDFSLGAASAAWVMSCKRDFTVTHCR